MGKKKPFIDKKRAVTFSLVYAGEGDSSSGSEDEQQYEDHDQQQEDERREDEKRDGVGEKKSLSSSSSPLPPPSSSPGIRRVLVPVDDLGKGPSVTWEGNQGGNTTGEGSSYPQQSLNAFAPPSWLMEKMGFEPELPPLEESRRREILELGFPDDGYDYLKHLRDGRPEGTTLVNLSETGGFVAAQQDQQKDLSTDVKLVDARTHTVSEEISVDEQEKYDLGNFPIPEKKHRQVGQRYVSNTISEIETLMQEIGEEEDAEAGNLQEDFLILATEGADDLDDDDDDDRAGGRGRAWNEGYAYEEGPEVSEEELAKHREDSNKRELELTEGRQMMEECFDQLVDEYDNLEIGDLEDADLEQTQGRFNLVHFDNILDEFISEKKGKEYVVYEQQESSGIALGGAPSAKQQEGEGEEVVVGEDGEQVMRKIVRDDLDDESKILTANMDVELKTKTRELAIKVLEESDDKVANLDDTKRIPVKGYENWDCESVLSLRSNFDNHPGKIVSQGTIKLSKKGIPLDYVKRPAAINEEEDEDDEEEGQVGAAVNGGAPLVRHKGETAEEKKARKQAVKQQKREARAAKKELKNQFKQMKNKKQLAQAGAHEGVSVRPM